MKKARKQNGWLYALASIVIGILFVWLRGGVVSIAMTVLGVALVAYGVEDLLKHRTVTGVVKLVLGIAILVCGWVFLSVALYIMAALLLVYGLLELFAFFRIKQRPALDILVGLGGPVICLAVAACLFFNQGGAIDWVFLVSGILLIVQGVLDLTKSLR